MPARCPYCGGRLHVARPGSSYQYDCEKCDRGWSINVEKEWIAFFDAEKTVYTAEQAKERLRAMGL